MSGIFLPLDSLCKAADSAVSLTGFCARAIDSSSAERAALNSALTGLLAPLPSPCKAAFGTST